MRTGWIGIVVACLALSACGGSGAGDEGAVEKAGQEQADRFSSGDFAGAWDMWVDRAKDVMSKDDYVTFAEACSNAGVPLEVASVRLEDDTHAVVRIGLGTITNSYEMEFEDDEWSWVPSDESMALYKLGAEGAIEAARDDGSCIEP